jgi:hypothetical protein
MVIIETILSYERQIAKLEWRKKRDTDTSVQKFPCVERGKKLKRLTRQEEEDE